MLEYHEIPHSSQMLSRLLIILQAESEKPYSIEVPFKSESLVLKLHPNSSGQESRPYDQLSFGHSVGSSADLSTKEVLASGSDVQKSPFRQSWNVFEEFTSQKMVGMDWNLLLAVRPMISQQQPHSRDVFKFRCKM